MIQWFDAPPEAGAFQRKMNPPNPTQLEESSATQPGRAERVPGAAPEPHPPGVAAPPGVAIDDLIYDLRLGVGSSDGYYAETARFADTLLAETERRAAALIDPYIRHVLDFLCEAERSRGEYCLDLLTLGLTLRRYAGAAESTPRWAVRLSRELYWLRRGSHWAKPAADLARALVGRYFLVPKIGRKPRAGRWTPDRLPTLIDWLQATGEFEQETRRLNNWRSFLSTLPHQQATRWMEVALELFDWFERQAASALGAYTHGVQAFLAGEYARRGLREDQIFCGRQPVEYHLAMVAAEIMNRGLREGFQRARRKVVLLPACMRGSHAETCQAIVRGGDILCSACDPDCAVNRLSTRMSELGAEVYLVPHARGFSRSLDRWQHEPDTGVTAVACLLNILAGGYEMRARRIPSQCVLLDYPGCEKHWRRDAIPTRVNEKRLVRILEFPRRP